MDPKERWYWTQRLTAGDSLVQMLQHCRALAVDADLPDPVHGALLNSLNLASMLHNAPERLQMREVLESLARGEEKGQA